MLMRMLLLLLLLGCAVHVARTRVKQFAQVPTNAGRGHTDKLSACCCSTARERATAADNQFNRVADNNGVIDKKTASGVLKNVALCMQ
jgi:hypothetical protein